MLTKHGYFIKTECISNDILEELTAKPIKDSKFSSVVDSFPIYLQTKNGYYIPKNYAIKKYGFPDKLSRGYEGIYWNDKITFNGQLYDYQIDIAKNLYNKCIENHGAILQLDVGLGKTIITLNVLSLLKGKTMIVVNKISLLEQWKNEIINFLPNTKIAIFRGKTNEDDIKNCDIAIAMIQSLSRIYYPKEMFQDFMTCVYDEVHNTSAQNFSKIFFKSCSKYSIGLSATPRRIDGCENVFKYHIGEIIENNKKEREGKPPIIKLLKIESEQYKSVYITNKYTKEKILQFSGMITHIVQIKERNDLIVSNIEKCFENKNEERKILVLSDRRNHLIELDKILKSKNVNFSHSLFLGGMKIKDLEKSKTSNVILATFSSFGEGVSEKDLNTLILTTSKKFNKERDSGKLEQIMGRIFRKPHNHVNPLIIDFQDNFSIFSYHAKMRNEFYKTFFNNAIYQNEKVIL